MGGCAGFLWLTHRETNPKLHSGMHATESGTQFSTPASSTSRYITSPQLRGLAPNAARMGEHRRRNLPISKSG